MIKSKRRLEPYFRIVAEEITTLNRLGIFSNDRAQTHIDITGDSYRLILDIIERFIKSKG